MIHTCIDKVQGGRGREQCIVFEVMSILSPLNFFHCFRIKHRGKKSLCASSEQDRSLLAYSVGVGFLARRFFTPSLE